MFGIEAYRAPLGRRKLFVNRYPARWAGLRDDGPLGLNLSANGGKKLQFTEALDHFIRQIN
jgi:hypothetical protein